MNVLSLFDGMSCGQIALRQLNIPIEKYYASEIDKYSIQITQKNHPSTIQLGDITKWREWDIDWLSIDLVFGGSPCQGFSFAGKQLAFDDPRSKLFFDFIDIVNHVKQHNHKAKFLLENVRMKKEYLDVISEYIGVQPVKINSALVSAQNRVRYYWTNIAELQQPDDLGILLKDIIESGDITETKARTIDANYFKGGKIGGTHQSSKRNYLVTGGAIRGRYNQDGKTEQQLEVQGTQRANSITTVQKDSLCIKVGEADIKGHDSIKRVYSPEGKSPTLTTMGGGHREPKIAVYEATKKGYAEAGVGEGLDLTFPNSKTRRGRLMQYKSNCLTSANYEYGIVQPDITWRKLTPLECERLQTVPDGYTEGVSNTQRYRMLGNGWTVEVIKHIFRNLL